MPVEPPVSLVPTPDLIQWIANKGSYYPFSEATGSDIVEFRIHGTVMDSPFLKGGPTSFSHSVSLDLSDEDIELLKSYVYKIPNYEPDTYRWPIQVNAASSPVKKMSTNPSQIFGRLTTRSWYAMKTFVPRSHMRESKRGLQYGSNTRSWAIMESGHEGRHKLIQTWSQFEAPLDWHVEWNWRRLSI